MSSSIPEKPTPVFLKNQYQLFLKNQRQLFLKNQSVKFFFILEKTAFRSKIICPEIQCSKNRVRPRSIERKEHVQTLQTIQYLCQENRPGLESILWWGLDCRDPWSNFFKKLFRNEQLFNSAAAMLLNDITDYRTDCWRKKKAKQCFAMYVCGRGDSNSHSLSTATTSK